MGQTDILMSPNEQCQSHECNSKQWLQYHPMTSSFLDQLIELRFYVSSDTKLVISETFFPANLLAKYRKNNSNTTKADTHL